MYQWVSSDMVWARFAVEYGYVRTGYFQRIQRGTVGTDVGENHQVLFAGFFYF